MINWEQFSRRSAYDRNVESDKNYYTKMDPEGFGRLFQVMSPAADLEKSPRLLEMTELFNCKLLNFTNSTFHVSETGQMKICHYVSNELTANGRFIVYSLRKKKNITVVDFKRKDSIKTERIFFHMIFKKSRQYTIQENLACTTDINFKKFTLDFYGIPRKVEISRDIKGCIKPQMLATCWDFSICKITSYNIQQQEIVLINFTKLDFSVDVSRYLRFALLRLWFLNFTAHKVEIVVSRLKKISIVCFEIKEDSKFSCRHFMVIGAKSKKNRAQSDWLFSQSDIINSGRKVNLSLIKYEVYQKIILEKKLLDLCCSGMFDEQSYFAAFPYELIGVIGNYYRKVI